VGAHRNRWFHTGGLFTQDADGWFHFADRVKDAMRVSGENVSAFEVEQVLLTHPRVAEAAVYAVPSEMGEDDVMAAVVLDGPEPPSPPS
jgi:crotonobetaine/carnitine-CoA ligase